MSSPAVGSRSSSMSSKLRMGSKSRNKVGAEGFGMGSSESENFFYKLAARWLR